MDFLDLNIDETFKKLNTSINGLKKEEVIKRRKKYGLNTFYFNNEFLKLFLIKIFNPIILLLLLTLIFTLINKNYSDSISISIIILITLIFNIILEYKSEYPINFEKLRLKKVWVIRNRKKTKISSKKITVGDIVVIEKNSYIKADMKVIVGNDIEIHSPLNNVYNENNILLAGDYIKNGSGMGVVFEIGKNTEIYKLAKKTSQKRKQKLPFKIRLEKSNRKICLCILIITFLLGLILYLKNIAYTSITTHLVSLIIASIPIFSIVILVLILYYFKKKNNKNMSINSLNLLGSIGNTTTIICNKEEFLTLNELTAKIIQLEDGSIYEIQGNGYNDIGEVIPINPSAKYKDSLYNLNLLGKLVYLNNKAKLEYINDEWTVSGNQFDIALLSLNQKINHCIFENKIIHEVKNKNYLVTFYKENDTTKISIRGNVEDIIKFCNNEQEEILRRYNYLMSLGYKVIGVAEGKVKNKKKYTEKDIKNLNFIGLIGLINPLKEESKEAIEMCLKEGIKVIINTNDNENNTEILGKDLNIITKRNEIATKEDIRHNFNLGERIFDDFIKEIKMFSNVTDEDLIKIIDSLKRQGETVATIGTDIEDIKSLKSSNISITSNSSIIKKTSDLTVNDNNLKSIINLIKEDKNISNIIHNVIQYLSYCNIIELLVIFLCTIFKTHNVLSINQILWIDLTSCILALGLLLKDNSINDNSYTKKIVSSKKERFKWILTGIFNSIIVFLFIMLLNKINLDKNQMNTSIILLLISLETSLLFYYKNDSIFKINFKEIWKTSLFISINILLQLIIFKSLTSINYANILITLSYSLIPSIIIEVINKIKDIKNKK